MDLLQALKMAGVDVRPEPHWETRTSAANFKPVGIMLHHTAGRGDGTFKVVRDGRPDLKGPLAHLCPRKDGRVHLLTGGVAHHAGKGDTAALERVKQGKPPAARPGADATGGNSFFYGIEIENLGDGTDPYPAEQIDAVVSSCVAICQRHGWTANHVIGHKEWTKRKIDPSFDMGAFRSRLAVALGQGSATAASAPITAVPPARKAGATATELDRDLIDRAHALELFKGEAWYYYPGGPADRAERDHFVTVVVNTIVDRLEAAK